MGTQRRIGAGRCRANQCWAAASRKPRGTADVMRRAAARAAAARLSSELLWPTAGLSERRRDHRHADQDRHAVRAELDGHEVLQRLESAVAVQSAAIVVRDTRSRLPEAFVLDVCFIHASCAGVRWR